MKQNLQLSDKCVDVYVFEKMLKKDWDKLVKFGIINPTEKYGNGFSNTTEVFDNNFHISPSYWNFFKISKGGTYGVKYESGCFYPIWIRVYDFEFMDKYIVNINTPLQGLKTK